MVLAILGTICNDTSRLLNRQSGGSFYCGLKIAKYIIWSFGLVCLLMMIRNVLTKCVGFVGRIAYAGCVLDVVTNYVAEPTLVYIVF